MKVIDTLDKGKQYCLSNITLKQKTQIFTEVFYRLTIEDSSLDEYLTGNNKHLRLYLEFRNGNRSWVLTANTPHHVSDLRGSFAPPEFKYITKKFIVV